MSTDATGPAVAPVRRPARTIVATMIGGIIEYYDFAIYGTAASLIFAQLFFPNVSDVVGTLLSLSTFGIAFIARPVGAAVFGHFGDRIGRKRTLFITLILMGGATVAIGLLPTFDQVGLLAPVLLVLLRLIQGFSLGGEVSGAYLMGIESAKQRSRGAFGAIVNSAGAWGVLVANIVFLPIAAMPKDVLLAWGWRIPFLVSAVLVIVGIFIRLRLEESPEFEAIKADGEVRKAPLVEAFRTYWRQIVLVALCVMAPGVSYYIAIVWSISYGVKTLGQSNGTMITMVMCMTVLLIVLTPVFGWLSDRWGPESRRRIVIATALVLAVIPYAWFGLFNTGGFGLMLLGFVLLFLPYCMNSAVTPTFFALCFPPHVRYSAMAVGFTIGTVIGASVAPLIAVALQASGGWLSVALYMTICCLVTAAAAVFLREEGALRRRRSPRQPAATETAAAAT